MTWLKRIALALVALVLLLALAAWWLLGSHAGLQLVADRVVAATGGDVMVQRVSGDLAGPLTLEGVSYHDERGTEVRVQRLRVDVSLWSLLGQTVEIEQFDARGIDVALPTESSPEPERPGSISLAAPIDIVLREARIRDLHVQKQGRSLVVAERIDLAGAWTDSGLRIEHLEVRSPAGRLDAQGRLGFGKRYRGEGQASFAWQLGDQRVAGTFEAHSDGGKVHAQLALTQPVKAEARLVLQQQGTHAWNASLDMPRSNVAGLVGGGIQSLSADIDASGTLDSAKVTGQVTVNDWPFTLASLRLTREADQGLLHIEALQLTSTRIPGTLRVHGQVALGAEPVTAKLDMAWQDVRLPAELAGQDLLTHGTLQAHGSVEGYAVNGEVHIGPPGQIADLRLDVTGDARQLSINELSLDQPQGQVTVGGQLAWQPVLTWNLHAKGRNVDPGQLFADWPGALQFDLTTRGHGGPTRQARVQIKQFDGTLRGHDVSAQGELQLSPAEVVAGHLQMHLGDSVVRVKAKPGKRNDIRIQLDIPSLATWLADARGSIGGSVHLQGPLDTLSVQAELSGQALGWNDIRIGAVDVEAAIDDLSSPEGRVQVQAAQVETAGIEFDSVAFEASGTQARHSVALRAEGPQLQLRAQLAGGMQGEQWLGHLTTLTLRANGMPGWHLVQPVALKADHGSVDVGQLCLTAGDPRICVRAHRSDDGALRASYRIQSLPLQLLSAALPAQAMPVSVEGLLSGQGQLQRSASGELSGHLELRSDHGSLALTHSPDTDLLGWTDLRLDADLDGEVQTLELHASLSHEGRIDGRVVVRGAQRKLDGQLRLALGDLAFAGLFSDALANVHGHLGANFAVQGTLASPVLSGLARISDFSAEVPRAGLELQHGQMRAWTGADGNILIDGVVHSGEGQLDVTGKVILDDGISVRLVLTGEQFLVADIPAARVVVSPTVALQYSADGIHVAGRVNIDHANVNVAKLPLGGATQASPDVVIVDQPQQAEDAGAVPLNVHIAIDFGDDTHLKGFGFDGELHGALTVIQRPGSAALGQGQINVSGTYTAYGQELAIERGRILFASTPLANPGLAIRAVRELNPNATIDDGQVVGLQISGTARQPVLTVFSNPAMSQADALSYLITGKPLSQVKGGEGTMVAAAAQALGSAVGDLLAKGIGARLGVQAGVSSSQALGGSAAFTVGKYLSPRLYLKYGVGLFEPGTVITLRYIFSEHWSFEAIQATDFSRAAFNYRYER